MEYNNLAKVLYTLGELYDKEITKGILEIYYDIFKDYSADEFKVAAYKVIKTHQYNSLPKPANILEYLEGTKDDIALQAWIVARKACEDVGYYMTPKFENIIISNCINELGGWMEFCSIEKDELPFIERRFLDLYRMFIKRGCESLQLVGFHNQKNIAGGYTENITEPILIGGKSVKKLNQ